MQAMFASLAPTLNGGTPIQSGAVHAAGLLEGNVAAGLEAIQKRYPDLDLGSYPYYRSTGNGVALVAKGTDPTAIAACIAEVTQLIRDMGKTPLPGEPPA
jgi:molybdopterin-biosynthesis enzyme MoeA-like protein